MFSRITLYLVHLSLACCANTWVRRISVVLQITVHPWGEMFSLWLLHFLAIWDEWKNIQRFSASTTPTTSHSRPHWERSVMETHCRAPVCYRDVQRSHRGGRRRLHRHHHGAEVDLMKAQLLQGFAVLHHQNDHLTVMPLSNCIHG